MLLLQPRKEDTGHDKCEEKSSYSKTRKKGLAGGYSKKQMMISTIVMNPMVENSEQK